VNPIHLWHACVALLAGAAFAQSADIPAGTRLDIRLTSAINTSTAKPNQPFHAVLIAPLVDAGKLVLAAGDTVSGHIKEVKAATQPDDQAILNLSFDQIADSTGTRTSLPAKVASVDNARESVDADGRILGIVASQTGSGRLNQGINKVAQKYPGLAEVLGGIKQAVLKDTDANIDYEPGTEITVELTKIVSWNGKAAWPDVRPVKPEQRLADIISREPLRAFAENERPSDITNVMFVGSEADLERAFLQAGWSTAAQLNSASKLETFRAMAEMRGYHEAPVSTLYLNGQPPDLVFQKQNNTFAARHHLRIWRRPGALNGKQLWICAATHDIAIDFSEENRTFIHKIDSRIDLERAKVVNDLLFTGLVKGLSLVERQDVPENMFNATGDKLETDGKIAVLEF